MNKILITLAVLMTAFIAPAFAKPNSQQRETIQRFFTDSGVLSHWSKDYSLWIEAPGLQKHEAEGLGHQLCGRTGRLGYFITFWHSLRNGPQGKIAKVKCN